MFGFGAAWEFASFSKWDSCAMYVRDLPVGPPLSAVRGTVLVSRWGDPDAIPRANQRPKGVVGWYTPGGAGVLGAVVLVTASEEIGGNCVLPRIFFEPGT